MVPGLGCRENKTPSLPSRALGPQASSGFKQQSSYSYSQDCPLLLPSILPPEKKLGLNCSSQVSRSQVGSLGESGQVWIWWENPDLGCLHNGGSTGESAIPKSPGLAPSQHLRRTLGECPVDQADFSPWLPSTPIKEGVMVPFMCQPG